MSTHLVNPALIGMAYQSIAGSLGKNAAAPVPANSGFNLLDPAGYDKAGFVAAGDPNMDPSAAAGGGGGAPPPGGDPSGGGGGAPPPAAPPQQDPSAIAAQVAQILQQNGSMGGGMGGPGVEPIKPKIDVNVEMLQIKKMLAKICDTLGIVIPASDMAVTSQDLTQMAQQQGQAGAGGAGQQSAIAPINPIQPAAPGMSGGAGGMGGGPKMASAKHAAVNNGRGFSTAGLGDLTNKAAAISRMRAARKAG